MENKEVEREVKGTISLDEGKHTGTIIDIKFITRSGYEYVDLVINPKDTDMNFSCSVPDYISAGSRFGKILKRFGAKIEEGEKMKPYQILIGKKVEFVSVKEEVDKEGNVIEYTKILEDTIKPLEY